jgi:hypothetical protein
MGAKSKFKIGEGNVRDLEQREGLAAGMKSGFPGDVGSRIVVNCYKTRLVVSTGGLMRLVPHASCARHVVAGYFYE